MISLPPNAASVTRVRQVGLTGLSIILFVIGQAGISLAGEPAIFPRIFMIGDSTMADKPVTPPNPERGWGQLFPLYLRDPAMVHNHAVNGRSTKSFIDEGRWDAVCAALRIGDWVIIQFAHNDQKRESPDRYADPEGDFPANLRRFIRDTRKAGAHPILATPIVRRRFNPAGVLVDTHGAYPAAMRKVAAEEGVPLLELHDLTRELVQTYGAERSKTLYLWIEPGEYVSHPQALRDDTHLSAVGASRVCELAAAQIRHLRLPLTDWLK